jgi:hypothetical protein
LTGFLVFILPGTAGQCAVATVFSILTLIVFAKVSPFVDTIDRYQYWLGCVVLFLSIILALLLKGDYTISVANATTAKEESSSGNTTNAVRQKMYC